MFVLSGGIAKVNRRSDKRSEVCLSALSYTFIEFENRVWSYNVLVMVVSVATISILLVENVFKI